MIKSFNEQLKENATVSMGSITGAGAMVNAQPGAIPGTTGTTGSVGTVGLNMNVQNNQEQKNRKLRKKTTDYSKKNKIETDDVGYGYKSRDFLKKIKKTSPGLIGFYDFEDTTNKN